MLRPLSRLPFLFLLLACQGQIAEPTGEENPTDADEAPPRARPFEPGEAVFPRLTATQYRNTVEDVFGEDLPPTPVEPDTNPHLFYSIGATGSSLSELGAQRYGDAAIAITDAVFEDGARRDSLIGCVPATATDDCAERFLQRTARRLFRRPPTEDEVARWVGLAGEVAEGDAYRGLRLAVSGMLQSPRFLYRIEVGEPIADRPGWRRYGSWEMAQRLSFLLWNAAPDEALLDAAARGELETEEGVYAQAMRLLESPRARTAVQQFFAQYLDLGRLDGISRDPERYPAFSPTTTRSMRTEVELLVDDIVFRRDTDVRTLFSTRRTYVNAELADLYGLEAPEASAVAFVPVTLPEDGPRAGVLSLGAFLTMNAHETETSPTLRGKYIRERVLCQSVPPPPPDIDLNLDAGGEEARTLRERLEQHREDPACATCHAFIDPPGMLFEGFDSLGQHRTEVDGFPVDATGELDGMPLDGSRDLAALLRDSEAVGDCIVRQLYRHANGRLEESGEAAALRTLESAFEASGYRFQDLLLALATSEGFRTVRAPSSPEASE